MSEVREQAKVKENEIHFTIEKFISTVTGMLRDREAVLISDVETVRHQKEKELQLQKDELEFLLWDSTGSIVQRGHDERGK